MLSNGNSVGQPQVVQREDKKQAATLEVGSTSESLHMRLFEMQWTVKTFQLLNESYHLQSMLVDWGSLNYPGFQKLTYSTEAPIACAFSIKLLEMGYYVSSMHYMLMLFLELLIHSSQNVALGLIVIIHVPVILSMYFLRNIFSMRLYFRSLL
ncbi:hypothetical protein L3X38_011097 [Prunus dulcis]|uniref:Uncharacterized protein n=1 Tax=Prunus dulcis TaxID=3755 RepID=A0AAD4ZF34_PRUDU|nr:hypothetical protein L3X38_011097 [Prunus dulcis]